MALPNRSGIEFTAAIDISRYPHDFCGNAVFKILERLLAWLYQRYVATHHDQAMADEHAGLAFDHLVT
jgi:hypothetical protein